MNISYANSRRLLTAREIFSKPRPAKLSHNALYFSTPMVACNGIGAFAGTALRHSGTRSDLAQGFLLGCLDALDDRSTRERSHWSRPSPRANCIAWILLWRPLVSRQLLLDLPDHVFVWRPA